MRNTSFTETEKGASKIEFLFQVSGYWYRPDTGQHTVQLYGSDIFLEIHLVCLSF